MLDARTLSPVRPIAAPEFTGRPWQESPGGGSVRIGPSPTHSRYIEAPRDCHAVLAVAGLGIALATRVMAGEELPDGRLTQLLTSYWLDPAEVYAIYPAGPRPSAKVRSIVDHLGASLTRG